MPGHALALAAPGTRHHRTLVRLLPSGFDMCRQNRIFSCTGSSAPIGPPRSLSGSDSELDRHCKRVFGSTDSMDYRIPARLPKLDCTDSHALHIAAVKRAGVLDCVCVFARPKTTWKNSTTCCTTRTCAKAVACSQAVRASTATVQQVLWCQSVARCQDRSLSTQDTPPYRGRRECTCHFRNPRKMSCHLLPGICPLRT